jgi:hypothetical protein
MPVIPIHAIVLTLQFRDARGPDEAYGARQRARRDDVPAPHPTSAASHRIANSISGMIQCPHGADEPNG